ncbi:hypothetical protein NW762_012914 [Fusarium torreyae]|uniref:Uncharacterized protein n=1 Tax=Fusarium torreyae TaxID=1237075 RepID=A0A9W8RN71_9HYPO|nr:hypothetical protein NW762_012914 [Fusarium torreyae]
MDDAKGEDRLTNYNCIVRSPINKPIPWKQIPGGGLEIAAGECSCDNWIVNELAEFVIDALPIICPDMALTAAETVNYIDPEVENPEGAWQWWLSPCGRSDLVPDEFKQFAPRPNNGGHNSKRAGENGGKAPAKPPAGNSNDNGGKKTKCNVPARMSSRHLGRAKDTLRLLSCDKDDQTQISDMVVTIMTYEPNATPTIWTTPCDPENSQAF